ncbi:MAG: aspartyl protease family protein [Acidobacteria bacterium]|nr:aspartyl protease family protein [Acidobacteriota bacterium]
MARAHLSLAVACVWLAIPAGLAAQQPGAQEEIPLERCDRLPVLRLKANERNVRFLVDTGATSVLNLKSFPSTEAREIEVTSFSGTRSASARIVRLDRLALGSRVLRGLTLPSVDLSFVDEACGKRIDGILGVDLLEKLGASVDLRRRVAVVGQDEASPEEQRAVADLQTACVACLEAFNQHREPELLACLDPQVVLFLHSGEYRGREQSLALFRERYWRERETLLEMHPRDVRVVGDSAWLRYDFRHLVDGKPHSGTGMMMLRRTAGKWQILSMHDVPDSASPPPD